MGLGFRVPPEGIPSLKNAGERPMISNNVKRNAPTALKIKSLFQCAFIGMGIMYLFSLALSQTCTVKQIGEHWEARQLANTSFPDRRIRYEFIGFGIRLTAWSPWSSSTDLASPTYRALKLESGWPWYSTYVVLDQPGFDGVDRIVRRATGFDRPEWNGSQVENVPLPLRVAWIGFTGDVMLAVAFLMCGRLVQKLILSRWRISQGRCVQCGYSIYGLSTPVCPECGHARSSSHARIMTTVG